MFFFLCSVGFLKLQLCKSLYLFNESLGEFNRNKLDGTETPVSVKRIVLHPGYDRSTMAHNIALLELEKPVKLDDHIRMVSELIVVVVWLSFFPILYKHKVKHF